MAIIRGGNCLGGKFSGGNFPGGSCPGGSFPGWELSRWDLSWVGIFFGESFPGGNCPVGIIRVGVFMLPMNRIQHGAIIANTLYNIFLNNVRA